MTALFADISGFTTLAERLDPEQLVEVVDPVLRLMSAIVERYHGRVVKFAGDAVLAFFGAPVVHEDDALRALLCARDMQREVSALVPSLPAEGRGLTLGIGVNTGYVVSGRRGGQLDYSVLGDAVNVAQRLEAAAGAGEILVGEPTRRLVGDALAFDSVGLLSLKGKAEPVAAYRLSAGQGVLAPSVAGGDRPLVGRGSERARVVGVIGEVAAGRSCALVVLGEAGVGKTRLMQDAARAAAGMGVAWLPTRCLSYGSALPYWPYAELLRTLAGIRLDSTAAEVADAVRALTVRAQCPQTFPYLRELLGADATADLHGGEAIPDAIRRTPEAMRLRIHDAVVELLTGLARRSPVALVIEDAHWIDPASAELTQAVLAGCSQQSIGVVLTARPDEFEPATVLGAMQPSELLDLHRLRRGDVADLAVEFLDAPVADDVVDLLAERTDGNPLFVREVLRALVDTKQLIAEERGWRLADQNDQLELPTTVDAVLSARIDRLPREAADVLQAASLIGRDVNLDLLYALLDADPGSLDQPLKVLVDRGLLTDDRNPQGRTAQFSHALVLEAALRRQVRRQRQRMHRRLVHAATALYGDGDEMIDLLAYHAYEGAMGNDGLDLVHRAARRAASLYANTQAITYLEHAVRMCGDDDGEARSAALLVELGELLMRIGDYVRALEVFTDAQTGGADLAAWLGRAGVLARLGRYEDALAALDQTQTRFPNAPQVHRARIDAQRGLHLASLGRFAESCQLLESAVAALRRDPLQRAEAQTTLARVLEFVDREADALTHIREAVAVLEERGDLARLTSALRVAGGVLHALGRDDDSVNTLERALAAARQIGDAEEEGAALINLGYVWLSEEESERAVPVLREALAVFARVGILGGVAAAQCNLSAALVNLGRTDQAREAALAGLRTAEEIGNWYWMTGALIGVAEADLLDERWEQARVAAERCIELCETAGDRVPSQRLDSARCCRYAAQHHLRESPTAEEYATLATAEPSPHELR